MYKSTLNKPQGTPARKNGKDELADAKEATIVRGYGTDPTERSERFKDHWRGCTTTENTNKVIQFEIGEASLRRLADLIGERILAVQNAPEPWIGIDALSAGLGIPKKTIYKHSREIPHLHGRPLRFKKSEVENWFKKR